MKQYRVFYNTEHYGIQAVTVEASNAHKALIQVNGAILAKPLDSTSMTAKDECQIKAMLLALLYENQVMSEESIHHPDPF